MTENLFAEFIVKSWREILAPVNFSIFRPTFKPSLSDVSHGKSKMLQRPQVLAQFSRVPLDGDDRIYAADVYSVSGIDKKKRTELAVAIDQEGIQIFDVGELTSHTRSYGTKKI